MKVKIIKNKTKRLGFYNSRKFGATIITLIFFEIQIVWGRKGIDMINLKESMMKAFHKNCKVCDKPLSVNSFGQMIFYHRQCRKFRNHPERYVEKLA